MISTFSDKAKAMNEPTKKADGLKENEIEIPYLEKNIVGQKVAVHQETPSTHKPANIFSV